MVLLIRLETSSNQVDNTNLYVLPPPPFLVADYPGLSTRVSPPRSHRIPCPPFLRKIIPNNSKPPPGCPLLPRPLPERQRRSLHRRSSEPLASWHIPGHARAPERILNQRSSICGINTIVRYYYPIEITDNLPNNNPNSLPAFPSRLECTRGSSDTLQLRRPPQRHSSNSPAICGN